MVRLAFAFAVVVASASSLVQANSFDRRQTLGGGGDSLSEVQGLMSLATNVANDIANGNATSACSNWVTALQACAPNPTTANSTAVAICACGSNVLTSLSSCAPAYGSTGTSEASGFSTFCTETLPKLVGSASATASQTSSSMTTSTRSAAGAASSTSAPASQITSSNVAGSAAANQAPSASASVTSGAGRVTAITTGAVAGAVVSLLVAFAF